MKPLAVIETDRRTERAALLGANHNRLGLHSAYWLQNTAPPFPKRSAKMTQKTERATDAIPSRSSKPNIYYKPHNFTSGPPGLELSRRQSRRLLSPQDGGRGQVVRSLSERLGWGQAARRSLGAVPSDASPTKVLLRAERAARASLRWRVRLDRPAPHRFDIALTLFVLLAAALLGAERGGQLDGVMTQTSHAGDWLARSVGLGVAVVTVSGATHMSESRILAIAGIDASRSLPFFDVAQAKAKLEADPLVKQASVRKLYPNQVVIDIVERTPYAVWQKDGDISAIAADGAPIDEVARRPLRRSSLRGRRRRERAGARIRRPPGRDGRTQAARRGRRARRPAALEFPAEIRRRRQVARGRIPKPRSPSFSPFNASRGFWTRMRWRSTSAFRAGCLSG